MGISWLLGGRNLDSAATNSYYEIRAFDAETGRPLPLVELQLRDDPEADESLSAVTDSDGRVALYTGDEPVNDPELTGSTVHYEATSHGYEGISGTIDVSTGEQTTIELTPNNIAERLYRITGQGIYGDSVQLGYDTPLENPLLNSQITGQDTVYSTVYDGQVYWFYGDTRQLGYGIGNYQTTGATSELPENGGLDPEQGIDLDYFDGGGGFSKPMVPLPDEGEGNLMWIGNLATVTDADGEERLVACYSRLDGLGETTNRGLIVFDDDTQTFDLLTVGWEPTYSVVGQGTQYEDPETGESYWFFATPFPRMRVPADFEAYQTRDAYEYFSPLEPGTEVKDGDSQDISNTQIERDENGTAVWDWKSETEPITAGQERQLIDAGLLAPEEARWQLRDIDTGDPIRMANGSVKWNDHRQRWVLIGHQEFGDSSFLGELRYAEAESPTGPWNFSKEIAHHDGYSFYNVKHDAFLDQDGGRYVHFEGTYTNKFTDTEPTPLYDYNQMMYRLDLEHDALEPLQTGHEDDAGPAPISDGTYHVEAVHSGHRLEVLGGGTTNGDNVQQWSGHGDDWQDWTFEHVGDGYYRVSNVHSGKFLSIVGSETDDGANAWQWEWEDNGDQRWRVEEIADGVFRLVAAHSGKVLEVYGGETGDGANVQQWDWHGGDWQRWTMETVSLPIEEGVYEIQNEHSGQLLTVADPDGGDGVDVQQSPGQGSDAQRWELIHDGSGRYRVRNVATDRYLSVDASSTDNGANVHQWVWVDAPDQRWTAHELDDGTWRLAPSHANKVLEVYGAVTDAGTTVQQREWNGRDWQRWTVTSV